MLFSVLCLCVLLAVGAQLHNLRQYGDRSDIAASTQGGISLLELPGPSESAFYFTPDSHSGPTTPLLGPVGSGSAHWHITQWKTPKKFSLSPITSGPGPCNGSYFNPGIWPDWYVISSSGHVCIYSGSSKGSSEIEIRQHTDHLDYLNCKQEFDTNLEPNNFEDIGVPMGIASSSPLSKLSSLVGRVNLRLLYANTRPHCSAGQTSRCGPAGLVDYGYITYSVTFYNQKADQTLFLQYILGDTRRSDCHLETVDGNPNSCKAWGPAAFGKNKTFICSYSAAASGNACLGAGELPAVLNRRVPFEFNVLPDILQCLPPLASRGVDQDSSHWWAGGLYMSFGSQGAVDQAMTIDGIDLIERVTTTQLASHVDV